MKKYLLLLGVLVTLIMSACSNDDIDIENPVSFKLNPATVVEGLYERSAGDLTSLKSGDKLNVALYVYDKTGKQVLNDIQTFSAYTQVMTSNQKLKNGTYKVVAISYVSSSVESVESVESLEFWSFDGFEDLNTLKIKDNGYVGGKQKILGLSVKEIEMTDEIDTVNIDIQNAGAVAYVLIDNTNHFSDVKAFGLIGKQSCDYITMTNSGSVDYSLRSSDTYSFRKVLFERDPKYSAVGAYFFTFPINKAALRFYAKTEDDKIVYLGPNFIDDIKRGESYLFVYDFLTDEGLWVDMTEDTKSNSPVLSEKAIGESQSPVIYDYEDMSISIK